MAETISIGEAQARVLARIPEPSAETVPLEEAAGRFLLAPARALVDLPPFPSSAMDGFALRSADTPGTLPVVGRIAAGRPAARPLAAGEAMGIATGGVVPAGADAVIPLEYVVDNGNEVEIGEAVALGASVRSRGGDLRKGEVVAQAGTRLGAAQLGALAAAGVASVVCAHAPRVGVLATGTELRRPGEPLGPGQVYEANGIMLAAALAASGAVVERLPAIADDPDAHRAAIERGLELDVLVTSGGVSVGPHDLVRQIEAELGVEEIFWRVAVKPGKPVSFGVRGSTLVFGLPGNPVSSLVGLELFVRPAIVAFQAGAQPLPRLEPGRLARPLRRSPLRDELVRARASTSSSGEAVELEPFRGQESHMIASAASADALVLVPRGDGQLAAGSTVQYLRLVV